MVDRSAPDYSLSAYDYCLPPQQIAQFPVSPRDASRLLVINSSQSHHHSYFRDLPQWLKPGDLLVLNNTRVIPARLRGRKAGGARVEVLLLEERSSHQWLALVRPGRKLQPGATIYFGQQSPTPELTARVIATDTETNGRILEFEPTQSRSLEDLLNHLGEVPLPPYIEAGRTTPDQYQTIYAELPGAVAAPTAGLHFTDRLFEQLAAQGIGRCLITLHVGVGTFRPVETDNILDHAMHGEWIDVPASTVEQIRATKARGNRVIAVGTTVVRALEAAAQGGELGAWQGKTDLFIYPGYGFRVIDGLITNFHLPGSSLLMLVSALIGRERLLQLYDQAIQAGYRFYSFGDAMVILPEATAPPPEAEPQVDGV
ncbi:MAG: tRNA preQ1(34) S-adenosylmethionine ribosyltransferase-isomerase QueA [Cyanobacteria bacterium REEB459]|nr:tRNA preQ1(34) S-adenosylmethionine ribosyltransferase-isomerase QueA [Cyanobacteria bacterium REEB459]